MKYWLIVTGLIFLTACGESDEKPTEPEKAAKKEVSEPTDLKTRVGIHLKTQLKITAADKFDSTWYSKDITGDGQIDYLITVNQLDRALNKAKANGTEEKMREIGYMGYYNHFFVVDGVTEEISDAVIVPSSPFYQLDINFEEILGVGQMDFYVDYRVRNMQRRKFYTISGGVPTEVCQAVIFDGFGTDNSVAYDVRMEKGTLNDYNDIVEYQAQLEDIIIPNLDSTYYYSPTIIPSNKEVRRWHYSPGARKYFMVDK